MEYQFVIFSLFIGREVKSTENELIRYVHESWNIFIPSANLALARPPDPSPSSRRGRDFPGNRTASERAKRRPSNPIASPRSRENLGFRYFFLPRKSLLTFRTGRSRARQTPSPSVRMQMRFRSPCQHDGGWRLERSSEHFLPRPSGK